MPKQRKTRPKKTLTPTQIASLALGPDPIEGLNPHMEKEATALAHEVKALRDAEEEREQQIEAIDFLMIQGSDRRSMARVLRERFPTITLNMVDNRIAEIRRRRHEDRRGDLDDLRYEQIRRIHDLRRWAMNQQPPDGELALKCEKEIAKMNGTYAPKKIDVEQAHTHTHAMMAVIANLDADQVSEMLIQQKEQERLANVARQFLPSIVVAESTDTRVPVIDLAASSKP